MIKLPDDPSKDGYQGDRTRLTGLPLIKKAAFLLEQLLF